MNAKMTPEAAAREAELIILTAMMRADPVTDLPTAEARLEAAVHELGEARERVRQAALAVAEQLNRQQKGGMS